MNLDKIKTTRERPKDKIKYISWIKRYGKGRVFYSSPSHNAHSMDNPGLVNFLLNGLYYAAGELDCDDSPILMNKLIGFLTILKKVVLGIGLKVR